MNDKFWLRCWPNQKEHKVLAPSTPQVCPLLCWHTQCHATRLMMMTFCALLWCVTHKKSFVSIFLSQFIFLESVLSQWFGLKPPNSACPPLGFLMKLQVVIFVFSSLDILPAQLIPEVIKFNGTITWTCKKYFPLYSSANPRRISNTICTETWSKQRLLFNKASSGITGSKFWTRMVHVPCHAIAIRVTYTGNIWWFSVAKMNFAAVHQTWANVVRTDTWQPTKFMTLES